MTLSIATPRLRLRSWRQDDLPAFAAMNADSAVMAHFPATMNREESDAQASRIQAHFQTHGFGLWVVEIPAVAPFIGIVGLQHLSFEAPLTPAGPVASLVPGMIEVGWRLMRPYWRMGYATEAAQAALTYGFETLNLSLIVAFTIPGNIRSLAVMERLGMQSMGTFTHPRLPVEHPLSHHLAYGLFPPRG